MLSVVHLFQEREEWLGQEEEVVAERREVGCQWESPEEEEEEERKDVGCQSDSAERRDVAVQVDLLTQQLCGMVWRCVAVKADEPGGGALLQHCGTPRSHGYNLHNTLLSITPLSQPVSPGELTQPEFRDVQQTDPSPSATPADASAAPPPGLIAPLSPHLAEEQEEEEEEVDEGSSNKEISDSPVKQATVTVETRKRESEQTVQPLPRVSIRLKRRSKRKGKGWTRMKGGRGMSNRERINQPEERTKVRIRTERDEDKNTEAEKENKKLDEVRKKKKKMKSKEADGLTPVNSESIDRPRRKAVGPPIRYLLEYEEQPHGKGRELKKIEALDDETKNTETQAESTFQNTMCSPKRRIGRPRKVREDNEAVVGRSGNCEVKLGGEKEKEENGNGLDQTATTDRLEETEHVRQTGETKTQIKTSLINLYRKKRRRIWRTRRRKRLIKVKGQSEEGGGAAEMTDGAEKELHKEILMNSRKRKGGTEEEEEREESSKEKIDSPKRPRRTMVGPPIRYLLESEEPTHAASHGPGCIGKLMEGPKRKVGRPRRVRDDSETGGGASDKHISTQMGLHTQSELIYLDPESGQMTIFVPCCVELQRLL